MSTALNVKLVADRSLSQNGLTLPIKAEKDGNYWECVQGVQITASFDPSTSTAVASCSTKADGSCAFSDSKFAVYFYINDSYEGANAVGGFHFKEKCGSGVWNKGDVWSCNGYSVVVSDGPTKNNFVCTIQAAAS